MGKNQSASNLPNIIQYNNGSINFVSGSTLLMQISSSGAITTTGVISGSNALSSSYAVSSSYSQNSELLDNLDSTAFVFTSSYNPASSSFSTRVTKIEGNYATTGSNVFMGAQTVCANITSTGTIVAQTLNVQQVTSSVVYSSGSNVFGCSLSNTQQFTGSVTMTGSLNVFTAGTSPEFQVAVGGTTKGNALTDIHQVTGSLRITGSNAVFNVGCVGIGTGTPNGFLHISTNGVAGQNTPNIRLTDSSIGTNGGNVWISADRPGVGYNTLNLVAFSYLLKGGASATNYLTIDNNGVSCFSGAVCASGFYSCTVQSGITIDSTTNGDTIIASRGLSSALHGIVRTVGQNGTTCMQIISTRNTVDGNLPASVNALWGLTNHEIVVATNNTERIRIGSTSTRYDLMIGNTSNPYSADNRGSIFLNGASTSLYGWGVGGSSKGYLYHNGTNAYLENSNSGGVFDITQVGNGSITFTVNAAERMRITGGGIACFASTVCAANISSAGFIRANATMKTFVVTKNFGERVTNEDYFKVSNSANSGYQVMVFSIGQNAGVGWTRSQLYQAATANYWGGWLGNSSAISTNGDGAPTITSTVIGSDGSITFRASTGDNGTSTTGTVISYIQVVAFNIDNISVTTL